MPVYEVSSPHSGRTYDVDFNGEPTQQDAEYAATYYDQLAAQREAEKPGFSFGDALSGIGDAVGGLRKTLPAAYYRLTEGMARPDTYSHEARAAFDAESQYARDMQQESQNRLLRGEASSTGDAFRSAGPSLGFSAGSMAAAVPVGIAGGLAGAKVGGMIGTAVEPGGGTAAGGVLGFLGGAGGAMVGAGSAAYRMAGAQFLDDAFKTVGEQRAARGEPWDDAAKEQAYRELLPLAQDSALWEAGPEAIGNAVGLGAGKIVLGLGKPVLAGLVKSALGKFGLKAGALATGVGTELATETATQIGQGLPQAQADAYARGQPMSEAVNPYDRPGGLGQALSDIAPQTLALSALMLGGGAAVKAGTLPFRGKQQEESAQSPSPTVSPSPSPQQSTLARIAAESVAPEEDSGAFSAQDLESDPNSAVFQPLAVPPSESARAPLPFPQPILQGLGQPMSDPLLPPLTPDESAPADKTVPDAIQGVIDEPQTITGSNVQMGTEMLVPPPTAQAGAGAGMVAAPQVGDVVSYEGYSGRLQQDGQRLVVEVPNGPVVEVADPATVQHAASDTAQQIRMAELRSMPDPQVSETQFMPAGNGTLSLRDSSGNTYVPHNDQLLRSVRTNEQGQVEVLLRNTKRPGQVIKLTGKQAEQAQDAILASAMDVENQGGKVRYGTGRGLQNLQVGNRDNEGSTTLPGAAVDAMVNMAQSAVRAGQTFAQWASNMVRRFGEAVRQYLAGVWQQVLKSLPNNAVQNVRMGRAQGTAPLSLPNSGAVINPFTPSDAPGWMRTLFKMPTIGAFRVQNLKVRQLLTGSALPKAMAEIVTASTRDKQSIEFAASTLANDLEQAMKAHSQVTGQSEQQINNLVTDVLQGTVPLSIILNPTLRTAIRRARNLLDNLSTAVGNATGGTLGQTITANLGQWMRRSYAAFDPDAGWSFDALTEAATKNKLVAGVSAAKILRDARNYLRAQSPGITNGELEAQMRQLMDRNLWEEALTGSGNGVHKDVTSLMKRKDIAPEILALMGEERNPVKKLLGSAKWQAQYIAKHDNQVKLRDLGLAMGMMSTTQEGRFTEAVGEDSRSSGFAVNGKSVYTTPELKAALNQTVGVIPTEHLGGSLMKLVYWLGGQAKLNKVALNPDSWLVNLMGNVTGLAMTGALSPFAPMRLFQNSRKAIELMRAGKKQAAAGTQAQVQNDLMRGMMAKLTAAGVADSSMNAAMVEDALNKSLVQFIEKHDVWNGAVGAVKLAVVGQALAKPFGVVGRAVGGAVGGVAGYMIGNERVQNVQEAVAKWTMQNPDRFGKIVEFLDNHTTLLAAGMTPDQAFAKATAKTLNTMPDYSKLPPVLRQFSRLGVIGSFIAFQWEVYRNSFHNAKYIVEELGSGNRALMEKGARRLLGMSSVYALALGGLQALLGNDAGDDDKDEAYRRALGKPWEKFTRLAYTRLDTEKASFYNTSYLLPQVTLTNIIRAAMEGKDFPQAMEFVGSTLHNQFLESGIHADPLIALLFNIDKGGQKASTEEGWRATVERMAEVLAPMTPGAADKFERILRSKEVMNQPRWDREFSVEEEMKRLLGIRQSTYSHDRRIAGRLSEFNNRKRDIAATAAQVYGSTGKAKADVWGQQQQQQAAQRASERLATLKAEYDQFVIDLGTLGFTPYQIQRFRKDAGTSPNWRAYTITPDGIKQPVTR